MVKSLHCSRIWDSNCVREVPLWTVITAMIICFVPVINIVVGIMAITACYIQYSEECSNNGREHLA